MKNRIREPAAPAYVGHPVQEAVFTSHTAYIEVARAGLSGAVLKRAVEAIGNRELFTRILGISSPSNLSRLYRRKTLDKNQSENVLCTLQLFRQAFLVFGNNDKVQEWMNSEVRALGNKTPISLCDTFKGRELVSQALAKIGHGDFS